MNINILREGLTQRGWKPKEDINWIKGNYTIIPFSSGVNMIHTSKKGIRIYSTFIHPQKLFDYLDQIDKINLVD